MIIYIYIILINIIFAQVHFIVEIPETGNNEILIIENIIGLEPGDEIGVFDSEGLITPNGEESSCDSIEGELLVGSGIYNGEQLEIVGIGSLDYCNIPEGYKLSGWVEDHPISIRVWDASEDVEYIPEVNYSDGGYWGNLIHFIETLLVDELSVNIDNFSLLNAYPNPFNPYITFNIRDDYQYNINISIYDLLGNNIYNTIYDSKNKNSIIWNASDYDSGIYLVKFYNDKLSLTKKISFIK